MVGPQTRHYEDAALGGMFLERRVERTTRLTGAIVNGAKVNWMMRRTTGARRDARRPTVNIQLTKLAINWPRPYL